MQWHLESPSALLLLLPFAAGWWLRYRKRRSAALFYPILPWLAALQGTSSAVRRFLVEALLVIGTVLLVIALARPQRGLTEVERLTEGVDIILALDTSGSMQAMDFAIDDRAVDRLTVVKRVAAEFVDGRPFDRIGVVVFGDQALTQCPPTLDHRVVGQFLDWLLIGMAGQGTAVGSAVALAVKRLESLKSKTKVVILLTDGRSNAGAIEPLKAAEIAKSLGIKVYTIGVGSNGVAPFPVEGPFGTQVVKRHVELDEETLMKIASTTGGLYFNARDSETLRKIYATINKLERTEIRTKEYHRRTDHFRGFLLWGFGMLMVGLLFDQLLWRRLP